MLTKDTHSSMCECTSEMIAYLYDEASVTERDQFETHLLECLECSDEFAELSNSRFSVFEWQKLEFLPLATPRFTVPFEKAVIVVQAAPREGVFSAIASLLAFNWRLAAAVGGLTVFVGLGAIIGSKYLGQGAMQTAQERPDSVIIGPLLSAVPGTDTNDVGSDVVIEGERSVATPSRIATPTRISTDPRRKGHDFTLRTNVPKPIVYQAVSSPKKRDRKAPTLNSEGDDDDDSSLRLTDLFESIGSIS